MAYDTETKLYKLAELNVKGDKMLLIVGNASKL